MDAIVVWIEGQALGGIGGGSTADLAVRGIAWIRVVVGQGCQRFSGLWGIIEG